MVSKHPENIQVNLDNYTVANFNLNNDNNHGNVAEIPENYENVAEITQNVTQLSLRHQCDKCNKILSNSQNYKYHIDRCKGTSNSLQCHNCYKILNNRSAKSRHLKICLSQALIPVQEKQTVPVTNSTTNNTTNNNIGRDLNNTINNSTTVNQTNNITILTVDPNKIDELEFITDHITNPQLKSILKLTHRDESDAKKVNMLETYVRQLMANPANKCIQKSNMQNVYSQIHTGDNKWETKHDKDLYPKLTCNVAQGFSGLMASRNEDAPMIKTARKLEELKAFLDYMADEGYRNDSDEKINHQTHLIFKELVQRIKSVVFDITKVNI
jgi:hypothetical protein